MRKILLSFLCLVGCAKQQQQQPAPAVACNPVLICNAAVKGAFKYDSGSVFVCAPAAQTEKNAGEYGWQPVRWLEKPAATQAPAPAAAAPAKPDGQ